MITEEGSISVLPFLKQAAEGLSVDELERDRVYWNQQPEEERNRIMAAVVRIELKYRASLAARYHYLRLKLKREIHEARVHRFLRAQQRIEEYRALNVHRQSKEIDTWEQLQETS